MTPQPVRNFNATLNNGSSVLTFEAVVAQPLAGITLRTPAQDFLKAVQVEASNDNASWQTLLRGQPVFRQPGGAEQLFIPLPRSQWRLFRVTVDDQRSRPVPWTGAQLHPAEPAPVPTEPFDVTIAERTESPGQTRLVLRTAAANVTLAGLTLIAVDPIFTRRVTLAYPQLSENEVREAPLATATLFRLAAEGAREASNLTFAADVTLPAREVILTIQNDDNPPLNITAVKAGRRPVYAIFFTQQGGSFTLLTGNAQCAAPRYDLAAQGASLRNAPLVAVTPSPLALNATFRAPEALANVAIFGSALDIAPWKFRKTMKLAGAGIQQLELDLEVLSHASRSFADLRVMNGDKQIPYLIERTPIQRSVKPSATQANDPKRPQTSRWSLRLPHKALPFTRLTCATEAPFFQRSGTLYEEVTDDRGSLYKVTLGSAAWTRTLEQKPAALALQFTQPPQSDTLFLEIENGDNPPLPLKDFECWYSATRVLFKSAAEPSPMLYYGNRDATTPRYDLDLVARQILSADKLKVSPGSEEMLKKAAFGERLQTSGTGNWLFWGALGLVVAGLFTVMAKMLPKTPDAPR
ncbi:MAG: DUF3999 family protein [Verrucomicrobia bacterium]|nr:DUF3999 family protein [Verrucomicrobiota bacterium]